MVAKKRTIKREKIGTGIKVFLQDGEKIILN